MATAAGTRCKGPRYDARSRLHISSGARPVTDALGRFLRNAVELLASNISLTQADKGRLMIHKIAGWQPYGPHR